MRYPKTTAAFALTLVVIAAAAAVAALIFGAAERNLRECEESFGTVVSIVPDMERLIGGGEREKFPRIGLDQYLLYAASPYVREMKISGSQNCEGAGIFPADEAPGAFGNSFRLVGGLPEKGEYLTITGSETVGDGECIVSADVARLNGLSIGDEISVLCTAYAENEGVETSRVLTRALTVAGLFEERIEFSFAGEWSAAQRMARTAGWRVNEIYTTFDTLSEGVRPGEYGLQITANYVLHEAGRVEAFDADLRERGLDAAYRAAYDESGYQEAAKPAQNAQKIATATLIALPVLGAAALLPLSLSAVRARRKETALLQAMGMRMGTLVAGILTETLLMIAVCSAVGFFAGVAVAPSVAELLAEWRTDGAWTTSVASNAVGRESLSAVAGSYRIFMRSAETPEMTVSPSFAAYLSALSTLFPAFLIPRAVSLSRRGQSDPIRTLDESRKERNGGAK